MRDAQVKAGRVTLLREGFFFGLVGLVNTAVGYGAILGLMAVGFSPLAANLGGYALGICVSYWLNSRLTFSRRSAAGEPRQHVRFLIAVAIAWLVNLMVLLLALRLVVPAVAQAFAMVAYSMVFFVLARSFVFAAKKTPLR